MNVANLLSLLDFQIGCTLYKRDVLQHHSLNTYAIQLTLFIYYYPISLDQPIDCISHPPII